MNFLVEKQPITCGSLVSTIANQALPSLHCALETAFTKSTSVLLISGAVCSAVHKRNNLYIFFIHILMEKTAYHQVMVHLFSCHFLALKISLNTCMHFMKV